uniref:C2H2-type domain-containing protein n=1 Tax=Anopheles coluzzii TaxID=1518534 RepID=A0A8W7P1G7_ANOCL
MNAAAQKDVSTVKNILKPWTKEPLMKCWDWCSPMLDGESLSNLFKCMGSYCSFNTNDSCDMVVHLAKHDDSAGIFTCAYCVMVCDKIIDLIDHIKKDHGQCRFQCGYCFYRSLDAANVLNHQQIYHAEDRSGEKSIIELPERRDIPKINYMSAALKGKVRQKILKCTEHVQTVHCGVAISCCWCLRTIKKDNVAAHLLTHYIGTYECLYCDYACNIKQMMQRHLSNVHPNKPLFCSKRREVMKSNQPNKKYLLDLRVVVPNELVKYLDPDTSKSVTKTSINNNEKSPIAVPPILPADIKKEDPNVDTKIPKILNVQGGIKLSTAGKILTAQQTLPIAAANRTVSFPNANVNVNRGTKRVSDSPVLGSNKRFRLIRSETGTMLLKLSSNANITVAKPSTITGLSARSPLMVGNGPIRPNGTHPAIITSRTTQTVRSSTDSCMTTSSTTSSFDKPTSSKQFCDVTQRAFATSAQNSEISNRVKIPSMTIFDRPFVASYSGYGEKEATVKQIGFHFEEFPDLIDRYYRFLCLRANRKKITPMEINTCGMISCTERFENHDALVQHMRSYHHILSTEAPLPITCSHCLLKLNNINTYIYHLTVHSLNQYVCFVCCYKHFLLPSVVKHMNTEHGCTSVQLSFAHPVKKDILSDIITVMPGRISVEDKRKYVKQTIEIGEKLIQTKINSNKPLLWSKSSFAGITATGTVSHKRYPKQAHYSLLYKCGLCGSNETSKISFQKHLIECPERKNHNSYICAHCSKTFKDWLKSPETIFQHLYYHGENLYGCGNCAYYHYLFENVAMHIKSVMHSSKCEINVLRESSEQWECNVCQLRSPLRQTIMEHMQNVHDLPGERFMCSLCKFRTFTNAESIKHFKDKHNEQDVVMIEMYHVKEIEQSSNNEDTESDSSDDLQIIEKVVEAITISSSIDDAEDLDERLADFDDSLNERINTEHRRVGKGSSRRENLMLCPVLREHSYALLATDETDQQEVVSASAAKVKVEKDLESDTMTNVTNTAATDANKDTAMEDSQQSKDSNATGETNKDLSVDNHSERPRAKSSESAMEQSMSPNTVMNAFAMERRASKRVAVKKDVTCRWSVCTKFGCLFCDDCFEHYKSLHMHSRIVHGLISKNFLNDPTEESDKIGSFTGFRLCSIKRCFYCDKEDTFSALRTHCETTHADKTFVCLDYWNPLKCGLCAYLNGSGHEKDFSHHYQQHHSSGAKHLSPFDHIDDTFIDWALTLGKKQNVENKGDGRVIRYICGLCTEQTVDELSMGQHVARHALKYDCPQCDATFKELKVLYDHMTIIHRNEDYVVPSAAPMIEDQTLLEVKMCFINGFILSKREAQYTCHGSIQLLEEGYQKYYAQQKSDLETHKELMLMPVLTTEEQEDNQTTCKLFMQNQKKYPVIKITSVEVSDLVEGNTNP